MSRRLQISIGLVLALAASACSDKPAERPAAPLIVDDKVSDAGGDSGEFAELREAFGVPLPPQIIRVSVEGTYARAETKLKLKEVKSFYDATLVDYEKIEYASSARYIGLRDFMPEVRAAQLSYKSPTVVRIFAHVVRSKALADKEKVAPKEHKKGDPVELKTRDGELLAPGARWGEPYIPPPGSPLAKKRYRSHFGKPFGTWTLQ